jgi:hypothetical protein
MHDEIETIEAYVARRKHVHRLLITNQFDELEHFFLHQKSVWLHNADKPYAYGWHIESLVSLQYSLTEIITHVQTWCTCSPQSYHAYLILGVTWTAIATNIQKTHPTSEGQKVGVMLARDYAAVAYLKAIGLDICPGYAYQKLMALSLLFDEPKWLIELSRGFPVTPYEKQPIKKSVWAEALTYLKAFGVTAPPVFPESLPSSLLTRQPHEFEEGCIFWLCLALKANPLNIVVRQLYIYYLHTYWAGDHAQIEAFIDGPLCKLLSEPMRHRLRFVKEQIYFNTPQYYPEQDDEERIQFYHQKFTDLLALDLMPDTRAQVLRAYAEFICHMARGIKENDIVWDKMLLQQAYDLLAEAMAIDLPTAYFEDEALDSLKTCLFLADIADKNNLFPVTLERARCWDEDPRSLLILAAAKKLGLSGIAKDELAVMSLLDRGIALSKCHKNGLIASIAESLGNISPAAEKFLVIEAAERGDTGCMVVLYKKQSVAKNGQYLKTHAKAREWLKKAAKMHDPIAQYELAKLIELEHPRGLSIPLYKKVKALYEQAWHNHAHPQILRDFALYLFFGLREDQYYCVEEMLPVLWQSSDEHSQLLAAYCYAQACHFAIGDMGNRYLAKVWIDRALHIAPQNQACIALAQQIYCKRFIGKIRAKVGFCKDRKNINRRMHRHTYGYEEE